MLFKIVDDAKPDIREWAHGERDLFCDEPGDELFVLEAAVAVVDAFDVEQVKGVGDVLRRAFLPCVRDDVQPVSAGELVEFDEQRWRIADLGRVQADPVELCAALEQLGEQVDRFNR